MYIYTYAPCYALLNSQTALSAKSHRLFASARRTLLYAMPPAAGQPAALQGTEPGQGHLRGRAPQGTQIEHAQTTHIPLNSKPKLQKHSTHTNTNQSFGSSIFGSFCLSTCSTC